MTAPASDLGPSALFLALSSGTRAHRAVDLPRWDSEGKPVGRVNMTPLTQEEMISAAAEAESRTRKMLAASLAKKDEKSLGYDDVYANIAACEILFRACKDVDDATITRGAFRTPHEIAKAFTNDEIGVLHHHYLTVKTEVGPIVAVMTDDEIDALIVVLAEGGSAVPLDTLSWDMLSALLISMASRLHASRTDKSSPGSPADQPTGDEASTEL